MPRTVCPDGQPCLHYSDDIASSPDMDGCVGPCRRGIRAVSMESIEAERAAELAAAEERGRQEMIAWMLDSVESDFQIECPNTPVDELCPICGEDSEGEGGFQPCVGTARGRLIAKLRALKATPSPSIREQALREAMAAMCMGCAEGIPIGDHTKFRKQPLHVESSGRSYVCDAAPIRALLEGQDDG